MASNQAEPSRFVVGIDLGTTNSAVCYVDTASGQSDVEVFPIAQLVGPGQIEERDTLPSFHYEPAADEFSDADLSLPWKSRTDSCVGVFARDHGVDVPGRLIASAKSWLCHPGVDRTARILPWQGLDEVSRLSPVDVSSRILAHIVQSWNARFPQHPLAEQTVVLTIPASFEEIARSLTVRAAQSAGLPRVQLIEEPQAAFYAWMDRHEQNWDSVVSAGDKILVCDVGGGTSDFTLIRVRSEADGDVSFHRVAVGDHLILGGDNLDLALAHLIEKRFREEGHEQLSGPQWSVLVRTARQVKEMLLGNDPPDTCTVNLPGGGRRLVGSSIRCSVSREEVRSALIEAFLPCTGFGEAPRQTASGFREFGLPYAEDTAITRYLSRFLATHASAAADNTLLNDDADPARPDIILFNGGLFESPVLRSRMVECIEQWFANDGSWSPAVLESHRLDLAVAHGAACFGMVSRGRGKRIRAGLPRSYYIGAHSDTGLQAVCLVPAGTEPGQHLDPPPQRFQLLTDSPVEFPVFFSGTRLTDPVGSEVAVDPTQLTALPPVRTVIRDRNGNGEAIDVSINCRLTEIGTLDLWCAGNSRQQWKLQFDVRSAIQTDREQHTAGAAEAEGIVDQSLLQAARELLEGIFGPQATEKAGGLARRLARRLGMSRAEWPTSLLRGIWQVLIDLQDGRRRSNSHEANWLNLLGYSLRPGIGFPLDDWRIDCTWDLVRGQLHHASPECRSQMWILWRRIAAGLNRGQQTSIASPILSSVRQTVQQAKAGRGKGGAIALHEEDASEIWRVLGAFEQLSPNVRTEVGDMILELLGRPRMQPVRDPMIWTLGRLGARVPMGVSTAVTLSAATAERWLDTLLRSHADDVSTTPLTIMQLTRRTGDRFTDVGQETRAEAVRCLREMDADSRLISLIRDGGATDADTQSAVFGESLPVGLKMLS